MDKAIADPANTDATVGRTRYMDLENNHYVGEARNLSRGFLFTADTNPSLANTNVCGS